MIGKLQGIVDYIDNDYVIIMTSGGVGYKVFTPDKSAIGDPKSAATLWIETIVRDDSIRLFGFATRASQELFNQLTTVSGVGPKVAMAILGALKTDVLLTAIAAGDAKTIHTAPGVGKKVAEKIILELKGKTGTGYQVSGTGSNYSALADLLSALESLGYKRADIVEVAQKLVGDNPDSGVEKLVPMALKLISGK
ncbi:MAG: Holliday junction branch migration protein RuvA [Rickettsiales bacterium]|jgi:Holliday junction DNA helicase RuvA|nr:Holliday junction branch migration protein RuvA [Rickettsiales bacterium]